MGRPAGLLLGIALAVFVAHAALLSDWVIDDAGISFAYARNLARGAGLVSQPGAAPVEGFSNPLWTLALAPFFRVGAFHPVWTPKLLSFVLVGLSFFLMARSAPRDGMEAWLAASGPLFLALNTSFAVWTTSGLENPLLALLLALSTTRAFRLPADPGPGAAQLGGAVGGLIALTRPEGAAYLGAFAALVVILGPREGRSRRLGSWALAAALVTVPYLVFRRLYFHAWVPNTFHAKVRPWLVSHDPGRLFELLASAAGRLAPLVGVVLVLALVRLLKSRSPEEVQPAVVLGAHLATAACLYLLLPPDWMGEYRFATPFFLFLSWMTAFGLAGAYRLLRARGWRMGLAVPVAAVLLLAEGTRVHADRSLEFARSPTVPLARISEFGRAYDALAARLPEGRGSLLLPDLGGTLFATTRLRLYDLAGLCDRTVARTLMDDTRAFHDYVLDGVRPTFIHVHGSWAAWAALHRDPRFLRDYAVLHEAWAGEESPEPRSGDYVRRDAAGDATRIARLREEFRKLGLDQPLP